jgi:hypothetical protein
MPTAQRSNLFLPTLTLGLLSLCMMGLCLAACGGDIRVAANSSCDGVEQPSEDGVDSPFDVDEDGYFDGENSNCAEFYELLDCDDNDAAVNPGATEVQCDGSDNDCNAETLESEDADADDVPACIDCDDNDANQTAEQGVDFDADGSEACFDCDDSNPSNFPGNPEVCDNADNDCSGTPDDGLECFTDYSGTWVVTPAPSYACAFNEVTVSFGAMNITDAGTVIVFEAIASAQPGAMSGTRTDDDFSASRSIPAPDPSVGCSEDYAIDGSFISMSEFSATLTATFTGGGCWDCANQSWPITGSR